MTEPKPGSTSPSSEVGPADLAIEVEKLGKRLAREKRARRQAEELLEEKSAELFDASERLKSESARARALASAVEAATDGLALTDAEGNFTYMNAAHAAMFDYALDELIGKSWTVLYSPGVVSFISEAVMPVVATHGSWRGELEGLSKSGEPISQEVVLTLNSDGGLICSTRDIGERLRRDREGRELETRLLKAEREAALFTVGNAVAHDFNNLIAAISGYALLLQSDLDEGSQSHERAGRILEAAEQASGVVRALEVERNNDIRTLGEIDLVKLMRTGLAISDAIRPRGISLDVNLPDLAIVTCNEVLLSRALMNIAKNAFDAMGEVGTFSVKLGSSRSHRFSRRSYTHFIGDPDRVCSNVLELIDTGPGISPEKLQDIFTPFTTTKGALRGSGLGLLSLKALADFRSTAVEVETWPGEGTCFRILFTDNQFVAGDAPRRNHSRSAEGARIILVDDNASVGQMLVETLERQGFFPVWESNPRKALQMIVSAPGEFDVLLTDLTMPQLAGDELARRVREVQPQLPIILYSGQAGYLPADPIYADILTKPISPDRLKQSIASALGG